MWNDATSLLAGVHWTLPMIARFSYKIAWFVNRTKTTQRWICLSDLVRNFVHTTTEASFQQSLCITGKLLRDLSSVVRLSVKQRSFNGIPCVFLVTCDLSSDCDVKTTWLFLYLVTDCATPLPPSIVLQVTDGAYISCVIGSVVADLLMNFAGVFLGQRKQWPSTVRHILIIL